MLLVLPMRLMSCFASSRERIEIPPLSTLPVEWSSFSVVLLFLIIFIFIRVICYSIVRCVSQTSATDPSSVLASRECTIFLDRRSLIIDLCEGADTNGWLCVELQFAASRDPSFGELQRGIGMLLFICQERYLYDERSCRGKSTAGWYSRLMMHRLGVASGSRSLFQFSNLLVFDLCRICIIDNEEHIWEEKDLVSQMNVQGQHICFSDRAPWRYNM